MIRFLHIHHTKYSTSISTLAHALYVTEISANTNFMTVLFSNSYNRCSTNSRRNSFHHSIFLHTVFLNLHCALPWSIPPHEKQEYDSFRDVRYDVWDVPDSFRDVRYDVWRTPKSGSYISHMENSYYVGDCNLLLRAIEVTSKTIKFCPYCAKRCWWHLLII